MAPCATPSSRIEGLALRHGYTPLERSLNPLNEPALPRKIAQLHVVGGADDAVPASLVEPFVALQYAATVRTVAPFTHYCCRETVWKRTILLQP